MGSWFALRLAGRRRAKLVKFAYVKEQYPPHLMEILIFCRGPLDPLECKVRLSIMFTPSLMRPGFRSEGRLGEFPERTFRWQQDADFIIFRVFQIPTSAFGVAFLVPFSDIRVEPRLQCIRPYRARKALRFVSILAGFLRMLMGGY